MMRERRALRVMRAAIACGLLAFGALVAGGARAQTTAGPAGPAPGGTAAGKCGVCHPSERVLYLRSGHAREDVSCTACHGGDASTLDQNKAHSGSFTGHLSRRAIPALCARCHADQDRMRPYDIPIDQYSLYQTSAHGKRLAAGNDRVAVCSDCHGAHDILSPSDPKSRVSAQNIPRTCTSCHANERERAAALARAGLPKSAAEKAAGGPRETGGPATATGDSLEPHAKAYREYLSSVHAAELLERDNLRAPTCISCHGAHGAAPQAARDVGTVCGQCHAQERKALRQGPHSKALAAAGLPECASCHTAHAIAAANPKRLTTVCVTCHKQEPRAVAVGQAMWKEYASASAVLDSAEAMIVRADAVPINTEDYRARLTQARTYLREALPAAHSVKVEDVTQLTSRARSIGEEVSDEVGEQLGHLTIRRWGLIVFWFYVLLTVVILRRLRKERR